MNRVRVDIDERATSRARDAAPFALLTIVLMVVVGLIGFAASLTLTGYADDLRPRDRSGTHAMSLSAIGYGGLVSLLQDMGTPTEFIISEAHYDNRRTTPALRIVTPPGSGLAAFITDPHRSEPTLYILPKWNTRPLSMDPDESRKNWVSRTGIGAGLMSVPRVETALPEGRRVELARAGGINRYGLRVADGLVASDIRLEALQYALGSVAEEPPSSTEDTSEDDTSEDNEDGVTDDSPFDDLFDMDGTQDDEITLRWQAEAWIDDKPVLWGAYEDFAYEGEDPSSAPRFHVLTEPDLLNTHGLSSKARAELGLAILDHIRSAHDMSDGALAFDLLAHGYSESRGLIKAVTQPPFLAATLCGILAALLLIWRGFSRFGDPSPSAPELAPGKRTLIESGAHLISRSGRVHTLAGDYQALSRTRLLRKLNLVGASAEHIDKVLSRRASDLDIPEQAFDTAARNLTNAADEGRFVRAAQTLHDRVHLISEGH